MAAFLSGADFFATDLAAGFLADVAALEVGFLAGADFFAFATGFFEAPGFLTGGLLAEAAFLTLASGFLADAATFFNGFFAIAAGFLDFAAGLTLPFLRAVFAVIFFKAMVQRS